MLDRLINTYSSLLSPSSQNNGKIVESSNNLEASPDSETLNFDSPPSKTQNSINKKVAEDCLSCRIIGGGGLTALGSYIIYYSFNQRHNPNTILSGRPSMFLSGFVGSVVMTLGFFRLIGINDIVQQTQTHPQSAVTAPSSS